MRILPSLATALLVQTAVAMVAPRPALADCLGFFNSSEEGYKIEGNRLEPTVERVAAGTEMKFNGIGKYRDKYYLTRSRSDVIYDAQNIEVTGGCDLPDRDLPRAK